MKFKIISFDIFQTLVDVNQRIPEIWQAILKGEYTEAKAFQGAKAILSSYPSVYEQATHSEKFLTMEQVYVECTERAALQTNFPVSPREVVHHLMVQHSRAPFYHEVPDCIRRLSKRYPIILSSVSSHLMVDEIIRKIDCSKVFISDDLRSYKADNRGRFFQTVLSQIDASPREILHIGDSTADILGASRAGIRCCWINRDHRKWTGNVQPDYTIHDFNDLAEIL
jgi:FMN hydrolase / 5-amino-6-(5-phospho-D-ribitylamino)uracil phosphatase